MYQGKYAAHSTKNRSQLSDAADQVGMLVLSAKRHS